MYNRFLEELQNKKMNYYVIDSPIYQERIDKAIEIIERIMDSNNGFQ
jgi:nicotinamide riboside kinase